MNINQINRTLKLLKSELESVQNNIIVERRIEKSRSLTESIESLENLKLIFLKPNRS